MEAILNDVITTLNTIPVAGIDNMRKLVGCTDALAMIANALHSAAEEPKEEKKEVTDG